MICLDRVLEVAHALDHGRPGGVGKSTTLSRILARAQTAGHLWVPVDANQAR